MAPVKRFKNFRAKVLLTFVAVYLISWLSVLGAIYFNLQEQRAIKQQEIQERFLQLYQLELGNYRNAFTASLEFLTHPSRISQSFTIANKPIFLNNFSVDYANLNQRISVSHFYFSTAERRNIVRMHAPDLNGDIINRKTTLAAENLREISSGVEIGRLGSLAFRAVKPIYAEKKLRGFVELGRELDAIWAVAARQLDISIEVLVDKSHLDRSNWADGKGRLGYQTTWDHLDNYVQAGEEYSHENMRQIMNSIIAEQESIPSGLQTYDGDAYFFNKLPLTDFSGDQIGTILIAYPQNQLIEDLLDDFGGAASASALALLGGLIFGYVLLSPAARSVQSRQMELETEIALRTQDLSKANEEAVAARDSAEIANKAKSEFLSNMSHELRTPLNAIIGFSSIVKNDELSEGIGEKYSSYADDIHTSGTHLLDIINDILDVSRIEAGEMEMRFQQLSIDKILHECHQIVNVRATGRSIPIIHDNYGADIWMDADATRLKQVILNLLTNAIKFTVPPGAVRFGAYKIAGNKVQFVVEDEGIGIAKKDLPRVLRRFGQAASSALAKRRGEGTGLGLTLVQDLVRQHHGEFLFESEINKGTKVTVILPMIQDDCELSDVI